MLTICIYRRPELAPPHPWAELKDGKLLHPNDVLENLRALALGCEVENWTVGICHAVGWDSLVCLIRNGEIRLGNLEVWYIGDKDVEKIIMDVEGDPINFFEEDHLLSTVQWNCLRYSRVWRDNSVAAELAREKRGDW